MDLIKPGHKRPFQDREEIAILYLITCLEAELEALEATIYAASVDALEQAREVVNRGLTFPVAYGTTREESELFGAWWENERGFIQPAELLLGRDGVVLGSMYASGPVGRMGADEAVRLITTRERRRREQGTGTL
jgi:peroxiredoxin